MLDGGLRRRFDRQSASPFLAHVTKLIEDKGIYHKNLMPVIYVTAGIADVIESRRFPQLPGATR